MKIVFVSISAICFSMAILHLSSAIFPSRPDMSGLLAGLVYFPAWDFIFKITNRQRKRTV